MERASIIYNPNATGMTDEALNGMKMVLNDQGLNVNCFESRYPGNTIELVKNADINSDLVVTMGGDGTLGEAFRAFGEVDQSSYYIHMPTGTANDTAENLGLLKGNIHSSIKLYKNLNKCMVVPVDMMCANDVPFAYVSCCGTFTNLTYETPKSLKKRFGKTGYYMFSFLMGAYTIPDIIHKPLRISYDIDDMSNVTEALTILISNTKTFAGFKLFPEANINDGIFEVTILKKIPGVKTFKLLSELFYNDSKKFDFKKYSKYVDTFRTDYIKITFDSGEPKTGFNHDGDHAFISLNDNNSVEYKISKKVKMLLPKNSK